MSKSNQTANQTELRLVGLSSLPRPDWDELTRHALQHGRIFQGYSGRYRHVRCRETELSFGLVPDSPGETPETASRLAGFDASIRSDTLISAVVQDVPEIEKASPMSRCVHLRPEKGEERHAVPAHILHSDLLPSLSPGDTVRLHAAVLADAPPCYFPRKKSGVEGHGTRCELIPLTEMPLLRYADDLKVEELVFVCGTVKKVDLLEPDGSAFGPGESHARVVIENLQGEMTVFHPLSSMMKGNDQYMVPGCGALFVGRLTGDAAVEEYRNGAVFDLEHDLRLLAECFRRRSFARAGGILAGEARLLLPGGQVIEDRDRILEELAAAAAKLSRDGEEALVAYGETELADGARERHADGEKCLIFLSPFAEQPLAALFAGTDDEGKLTFLSFEKDADCRFRHIASFDDWRTGAPAAEEEETDDAFFFESAKAQARTAGDPKLFKGTPSEAVNDIMHLGLDLTEGHRHLTLLGGACLPEGYSLRKESEPLSSGALFCPDPDESEAGMVYTCSADEKRKAIAFRSILPVLPGHVNRLTIGALYVWRDRENGEAAAYPASRSPVISFQLPFFRRDCQALKPGQTADISLYAVALDLKIEKPIPLGISVAEMRKTLVQKFLRENPLMSEQDFPEFRVKGGAPLDCEPAIYTSRMHLQTVVLESSEFSFHGIPLCRLLVPVTPCLCQEDPGIQISLYARRSMLEGRMPEVADPISCTIWLGGTLSRTS